MRCRQARPPSWFPPSGGRGDTCPVHPIPREPDRRSPETKAMEESVRRVIPDKPPGYSTGPGKEFRSYSEDSREVSPLAKSFHGNKMPRGGRKSRNPENRRFGFPTPRPVKP